jgi:hypothetical protein
MVLYILIITFLDSRQEDIRFWVSGVTHVSSQRMVIFMLTAVRTSHFIFLNKFLADNLKLLHSVVKYFVCGD